MFVDTHAHIYLDEFAEDFNEVIQRCVQNKVDRIYMPNVDVSSISQVKKAAARYPEMCIPQMGLHPCYVKEDFEIQLKQIEKELFSDKYAAVGEIGIDLYWDKTFVDSQIEAFKRQIEWSRDLNLPIVIHSRESLDLTIDTVGKMQKGGLTGIFHCFGGSVEQIKKIKDLGFFIGIGGVATFKNGGIDKILTTEHLNQIVLETDAPYLTPVPHRGKRNESAYIPLIAQKLSQVLEVSMEEIARITTNNANKVYQYTPL